MSGPRCAAFPAETYVLVPREVLPALADILNAGRRDLGRRGFTLGREVADIVNQIEGWADDVRVSDLGRPIEVDPATVPTVSTSAAARAPGLTPRHLTRLCASGRFPGAKRVDGRWQIPETELAEVMENQL